MAGATTDDVQGQLDDTTVNFLAQLAQLQKAKAAQPQGPSSFGSILQAIKDGANTPGNEVAGNIAQALPQTGPATSDVNPDVNQAGNAPPPDMGPVASIFKAIMGQGSSNAGIGQQPTGAPQPPTQPSMEAQSPGLMDSLKSVLSPAAYAGDTEALHNAIPAAPVSPLAAILHLKAVTGDLPTDLPEAGQISDVTGGDSTPPSTAAKPTFGDKSVLEETPPVPEGGSETSVLPPDMPLPEKKPNFAQKAEGANLGKSLSAGGSGGKSRSQTAAVLSTSSRDNENGALMSGLMQFAISALLKPSWSIGDSLSSAVQDAADSYTNYQGQRQAEVNDERKGRMDEAKLLETNASTAEKYAQASKAKSAIGLDKANILALTTKDKGDPTEGMTPRAAALYKAGLPSAAKTEDINLSGKTPDQKEAELFTAAQKADAASRAAGGKTAPAAMVKNSQTLADKGMLDLVTLEQAHPGMVALARNALKSGNAKAANQLRNAMSRNPSELAKLEQELK